MSSSFICQTCRSELRKQLSHGRRIQWQPRATFISFNDIVPPPKEKDETTSGLDTSNLRPSGVRDEASREESQDRRREEEGAGLGRYSRFGAPQHTTASTPTTSHSPAGLIGDKPHRQNLRSLQSSVTGKFDNLFLAESFTSKPQSTSRSRAVQDSAAKIERRASPAQRIDDILLQKDHEIKDAWQILTETYATYSLPLRFSGEEKTLIKEKLVIRRLLHSMCSQWEPAEEGSPSPAEVVALLDQLGLMRGSYYLTEVLEMIYRMIRFDTETSAEESAGIRFALELQTLSLWSLFLRNNTNKSYTHLLEKESSPVEGAVDWAGTVHPESIYIRHAGKDAFEFENRFHHLFAHVPMASKHHLAAAAALTFDYFTSRYCQSYATRDERLVFEPFLNLIIKNLHGSRGFDNAVQMSRNLLEDNKIPKEEIQKMANRMGQAESRAALALAIKSNDVLGGESINLTPEQEDSLQAYFQTRIKRQVETLNCGVMDKLWQQAKLTYSSPHTTDGRHSASMIPAQIYSAFLFGYRELDEPGKQTQVWNHIVSSKSTPTADQWGMLISARVKDLSSMEHVWTRMIESGTKPTHPTWCTRIKAHIYHGHPEEGIQMMYQWGNLWLDEVRAIFEAENVELPEMWRLTRDGPTVARPNTDTLTTAITALVQRKSGKQKRLDLIPDAFAWAQKFGIKPSVWVYNILFRTCLKDDNLKEAMQVLTKMEDDGIRPDAYTFYGFADFVFKSSTSGTDVMSEDDQYKLIFEILDMLELKGLDPNAVFFGTMIDGLLKRQNNLTAATMLLRIMMDKKITIPSQIWTSIMTHHFQAAQREDGAGVPDFAAIEALWRQMQQITPLTLDSMFYDRMIEGFARYGDVQRAAVFLNRISKEGKRPSWGALTAVLQGYMQVGLTDQARALVSDVVSGYGIAQHGVSRGRIAAPGQAKNPDRERFFEVARSGGFMAELEKVDLKSLERGSQDVDELFREGHEPKKAQMSVEDVEATFASPGLDLRGTWEEHVEKV